MNFGDTFEGILERITKNKDKLPPKTYEDCCYYIHDAHTVCDKKLKCCVRIEMSMKRCPHFDMRKEFR